MFNIITLSFAQLKNAEHVAFFNNVAIELEKKTAEALGLTPAQLSGFRNTVDAEQDIVNRSTASEYTPEMKAFDDERDRLYRLIRGKLALCPFASPGTALSELSNRVQNTLLNKYGNDVIGLAYQEETATIRGFILDVTNFFDEDEISDLGIATDIVNLQKANNSFSEQYNMRVKEKSITSTELTKKLRTATEEAYEYLALHIEFKANADTTEVGETCATSLAIINQLIKDARARLNARLGKTQSTEVSENTEE